MYGDDGYVCYDPLVKNKKKEYNKPSKFRTTLLQRFFYITKLYHQYIYGLYTQFPCHFFHFHGMLLASEFSVLSLCLFELNYTSIYETQAHTNSHTYYNKKLRQSLNII